MLSVMNLNFFHLNKHAKIVIALFIIGSILIICLSLLAVNNIQSKLDKNYFEFAQVMTKSVAAQTSRYLNITDDLKNNFLKEKYSSFISDNDDVAFIDFKDENNNLIFSSRQDTDINFFNTVFSVSSPVIYNNSIIGSVSVGFSGKSLNSISSAAKKSLWSVFIAAWLILSVIILFSYLIVSKELSKLYKAVKQISIGKFGVKVDSDNMSELASAFNDMSKLLSQYEQQNIEQITLERNKLEAVLMSIINGVIVCDNFDNVVLVNSAALNMLDVEEKKFLNTKIQNFTDIHGQKCFLDKIEEFKDTPLNIIEQKPVEFNIEAGKKTIKAMISPMFSQQQDYVGYIIVLIDVTRETEVNKLKNTFISNVSHELRTPVTVLRTYIDTLCNNGDDFDEDTKKEFLKTLDTEAKRLHTMVNDILDFSRLESGSITLKKEYSNIPELLEQNINSIKVLADEKDISIDFKILNDIPLVPVNIESIDRVIRNLLSNAIKYSENGKNILVSVNISEDNQFVTFSVRDNGIGIPKEHLDKIFDRFYRVENATHSVKGTGLGLHLVKMTVEKYHNGKITVSSVENEGSTFTVYLPIHVSDDELV